MRDRYDVVVVAYGDCGRDGAIDTVLVRAGLPRLEGGSCYDVLARDDVLAALREGLAQRRRAATQAAAYGAADPIGLPLEVRAIGEAGLKRALQRLIEAVGRTAAGVRQEGT